MRKYTKEILSEAAKASENIAQVLRHLEMKATGYNHSHISKMLKDLEVDTSHFTGRSYNRNRVPVNKKTWQDFLTLRTSTQPRIGREKLLRSMLEYGFRYECSECLCPPMWYGRVLVLEIDHINGLFWDNRPENLRFLCPNCHSQQTTTNRPRKHSAD